MTSEEIFVVCEVFDSDSILTGLIVLYLVNEKEGVSVRACGRLLNRL